MKKKLLFIAAGLLAATMIFAGCGSSFAPPQDNPAIDAPVVSNGGLVVKKGDYYYYINGKATASAPNNDAATEKGALMRAKADELDKPEKHVVVIPRLIYSEYAAGGFSIFNDGYIYYTSPYDEKDKKGEIQSGYMSFWRSRLDGTRREFLAVSATQSHALPYRYIYDAASNKTFLVYVENSKIYTMDCSNPKSRKEAVSEYTNSPVLSDIEGDPYIYYTAAVYYDTVTRELLTAEERKDNDNAATASYNKVMRYNVVTGAEEMVYPASSEDLKPDSASRKYTFSLSKIESGYLYYTKTEASGGLGFKGLMRSARTPNGGFTVADSDTLLTRNTSVSTYITAPDGADGQADGVLFSETQLKWLHADGSIEIIMPSFAGTFYEVRDNSLYYFDSSKLMKFSLTLAPGQNWYDEDVKAVAVVQDKTRKDELPQDTLDTGWLKPEYLDGKWFFFNSASNAFDQNTAGTDEEKYQDATLYVRSGYMFVYDATMNKPYRIGKLTEADRKTEEDSLKTENENRAKELAKLEK